MDDRNVEFVRDAAAARSGPCEIIGVRMPCKEASATGDRTPPPNLEVDVPNDVI